jgi:hypothetical protein
MIRFESVSAAGRYVKVEAQLVWADDDLIAVLVPVEGGSQKGWFPLLGLGPCDVEGVYFRTLDAARLWAESRIPLEWNGREAARTPSPGCEPPS